MGNFKIKIGIKCLLLFFQIRSDPVSNIMFLFLGISLFTTLTFLFSQKFNIGRLHGLTLLFVYLIFIICVILSQLSFLPFPF